MKLNDTALENNGPKGEETEKWARRFFVNVVWSWVGVLTSFLTGFFLSPYIIRKLGDERYGIWALAFAFIDYTLFFDFGFKSAITNLISRFRAQNQEAEINEVVNTAFFYFLGIATFLASVTWLSSGHLYRFFQISPAHQPEFAVLVRTIGIGWAAAIALNVFSAGLEAFQAFKTQNHIGVLSLIFRSGSCALLLYYGFGLPQMGIVVTVSQFMNYGLAFFAFRRAFPGLRISISLVRPPMWMEMARYGVHSFVAQVGTMLQNQGPPMLIGHFRPEAFVGYYQLPSRLLAYVVDPVTRIASVTMPNSAEMLALGRNQQIARLATYLNRYCFALFLPFGIFLLLYGGDLIPMWVGPAFGRRAAPLLLPFVLLTAFSVAGQFNSVGILFGMAKHSIYSRALIAESLLSLAVIAVVLPRYGILGAAWTACTAGILNRGLFTSYLLCRNLDLGWLTFMRSIYVLPLLMGVPTAALGYLMRVYGVTGRNWFELLAVLALLSLQYYSTYLFAGVEKEHRLMIWGWVGSRLRAWVGPDQAPPGSGN
ncbi:MAG TPA: oligosaccharide flippase family protein [Bryobacteraceae bacterium]|nr:oligosaccharide flippase family protein [Bryobacteraceae bacterium]